MPAAPNTASLKQLVNDAMILARDKGYDVFNALDLMQVRGAWVAAMGCSQ